MPRLVIKPIELLKILAKHYGFRPIRQKGSHLFISNFKNSTVIPMHGGELDQGTLNSILKQTGLTKEDILKYL
ncbi:MAG: type II toxin-antitoxin system HicA family toxin [Candidatus Micrarchaeaceae archaeon]